MKNYIEINSVSSYNTFRGAKTYHPLISVLDYKDMKMVENITYKFGLYGIFYKKTLCGDLKYGKQSYDYQEESLVFVAPQQILTVGTYSVNQKPQGKVLLFHPDFIRGTELGKKIYDYTFFYYRINEALHLSYKESNVILDLFNKICVETQQNIDKHSKTIMVDTLQLILNYAERYYDRQFITRANANLDIVQKFEQLLNQYLRSEKPLDQGLPSVAFCAAELNLSTNYFGDLIKKEVGVSAQEFIQTKIIEVAKTKIFDPSKTISQVAYELGFKYPQHFNRMFKKKVGRTPNDFRIQN